MKTPWLLRIRRKAGASPLAPTSIRAQFGLDGLHTNPAGAEANAADVVSGLRALPGMKFRAKLSRAGRQIEADAGASKTSVCPALK
jgi:hypothetical protein